MKNFRPLALALALVLCSGCSTVPGQSFRQNVGRPIARAGENVGQAGNLILAVAGMSIVLIPFGILCLPVYVAGAPIYYGGCAIAWDKPETYPPEL